MNWSLCLALEFHLFQGFPFNILLKSIFQILIVDQIIDRLSLVKLSLVSIRGHSKACLTVLSLIDSHWVFSLSVSVIKLTKRLQLGEHLQIFKIHVNKIEVGYLRCLAYQRLLLYSEVRVLTICVSALELIDVRRY